MIDILDKKILESTFAEDFASPYFPILAEFYLNDGDLSRARKVCEIGLGGGFRGDDVLAPLSKMHERRFGSPFRFWQSGSSDSLQGLGLY